MKLVITVLLLVLASCSHEVVKSTHHQSPPNLTHLNEGEYIKSKKQ